MARHPHKWEEMLPEEFFDEFARAPVAYWACGAMEDHGLHNALGTDPWIAYELCLRAAEVAGGIVFPVVPFAPAGIPGFSREKLRSKQHQLYYPSVWISEDTCERVYVELLEALADMGFKACVAISGHYPGELSLRKIEERYGGRIGEMRFIGHLSAMLPEERPPIDPRAEGHGVMLETSMIAAVHPDWVDLSRVPRIMESPIPSQVQQASPEQLEYLALASPAVGEQLLKAMTRYIVRLVGELLQSP